VKFTVPAKTTNPANGSQGRTRGGQIARSKARAKVRRSAWLCALSSKAWGPPMLPVVVTMRRVAPSAGLDEHDGLRGALKPVVDGLADALGLKSDRDPRVRWAYDQRRGRPGEYAVEVEVREASEVERKGWMMGASR